MGGGQWKKMAPLSAEESRTLVLWVIDALVARMLNLRPGEYPSQEDWASILESAWKKARKPLPKWLFLADIVDTYIKGLRLGGPKAVMKACEHLTKENPKMYGRNPEALKVRYYESKRELSEIRARMERARAQYETRRKK